MSVIALIIACTVIACKRHSDCRNHGRVRRPGWRRLPRAQVHAGDAVPERGEAPRRVRVVPARRLRRLPGVCDQGRQDPRPGSGVGNSHAAPRPLPAHRRPGLWRRRRRRRRVPRLVLGGRPPLHLDRARGARRRRGRARARTGTRNRGRGPPRVAPRPGGPPLHTVAFLAGDRLATAVGGGETISLWTVAPGDAPRRDHALALARPPANTRPARARRVAAAGGGAFVLVTAAAPATDAAADESGGGALYVAHVDAETNKIDHVAPFAVSQPVLSLAALDADLTDDANDAEAEAEPAGFEIQLFCVQTRAIQQYFLRPSALYPATAAPAPAPAALAFDVAAA